jgi:hypothetical protein
MTQTTFVFTTDYKNEFKRYIDELFTYAKVAGRYAGYNLADRAERMALIDELIESYIAATGQRPDSVQLDRLATLCLREELTDSTPYKVRNTEYPISSDRQELEYMKKRVPVEAAQNYAADGENWNAPYRRKRSKAENAYMDRNYGKSRKKKV